MHSDLMSVGRNSLKTVNHLTLKMKQISLKSGLIHIKATLKELKYSAFILQVKVGCINFQVRVEHPFLRNLTLSLELK